MQECGSLKNEGGASNILRPQLVISLFIVIPAHAVKVCHNYASALIIYKTNIKFSFLLIISHKKLQHKQSNEFTCFDGKFQKYSLIMSSDSSIYFMYRQM